MADRSTSDVGQVLATDTRRRSRRRVLKLVVGVVLIGAVAAAVVAIRANSGPARVRYKSEPLTTGTLQVLVTATGTVQAKNTVDVGAEVTGRLIEVPVDFNDRVEQGQVLARIDPQVFELDVAQVKARVLSAKAALASARSNVAEAERNRERGEALARDGLLARQDLETLRSAATRARNDVASAEARVAETEAALQASTTRLEKTTIRSPIAGIVLDRKVQSGQTVTAGFQTPVLFSLATDLAEMELRAAVDEADVGRVAEGQEATFTVDAYPERVFRSRVLSIRNVAKLDQNVVSYEAVMAVENEDRALRPGMTATATIVTANIEGALLVPNAALRFKPPTPDRPAASSGGPRLPFMMGPPRHRGGDRADDRKDGADTKDAVVWTLEGGVPTSHRVRKGETDGEHTVVQESDLQAGVEVLTEVAQGPEARP